MSFLSAIVLYNLSVLLFYKSVSFLFCICLFLYIFVIRKIYRYFLFLSFSLFVIIYSRRKFIFLLTLHFLFFFPSLILVSYSVSLFKIHFVSVTFVRSFDSSQLQSTHNVPVWWRGKRSFINTSKLTSLIFAGLVTLTFCRVAPQHSTQVESPHCCTL